MINAVKDSTNDTPKRIPRLSETKKMERLNTNQLSKGNKLLALLPVFSFSGVKIVWSTIQKLILIDKNSSSKPALPNHELSAPFRYISNTRPTNSITKAEAFEILGAKRKKFPKIAFSICSPNNTANPTDNTIPPDTDRI